MSEKRPALGRGLDALIPQVPKPRPATVELDIDQLSPNAHQPRSRIDEGKLDELARSIKSNGIIQPILVRQTARGYEIVAGERRWRAAQRAGMPRVPVVIRDVPDERLLEVALIENIQRENLNPIEEAQAYKHLADQFHLRQDEIALAVGKDRSSIANYLRLLRLPDEVRGAIADGTLSMGHARALLGFPDLASQKRAAREVVKRGLSVRDTERFARNALSTRRTSAGRGGPVDVHTRAAEERLRLSLGTPVRVARKGGGGRIVIAFASEDELHRIYQQLVSSSPAAAPVTKLRKRA